MERLLAVSDAINAVLVKVAMAVGWLFLALTAVIVFDVLSRKFGFQIPEMGSTRLQELEWHLHTAIFTFWLGVGYIKNSHVRIDIALSGAKPRTLAITRSGHGGARIAVQNLTRFHRQPSAGSARRMSAFLLPARYQPDQAGEPASPRVTLGVPLLCGHPGTPRVSPGPGGTR